MCHFFRGVIKFAPWRKVWNCWAPLKWKYFVWFALNNRCWTADRLTKRGLSHLWLALNNGCWTRDHLTWPPSPSSLPVLWPGQRKYSTHPHSCVRQVWTLIFQKLKLYAVRPPESTSRFYGWWCRTLRSVPKEMHKGVNSLVILVAWELWKQWNVCVFKGARPNVQTLLYNVAKESSLWCMAGATALQELLIRSLSPEL
jgi:hypothetical protein